jgi:hypothetical protein
MSSSYVLILELQGVSTQTCILHFALAGRKMQASFGLKVVNILLIFGTFSFVGCGGQACYF